MNKNILIPRNIEGRKDKLRQDMIKLLSQDVIEGSLRIDENFLNIPEDLIKVKEIKGNVRLTIRKGYIPSWLKDVKIYGKFSCAFNKLRSLKNCPQWIEKNFICSFNNLTSLEGGPKYVGGDFYCQYNNLTSLDDYHAQVDGIFCCLNNRTYLENSKNIKIKGKFINKHV